MIAILPVSESCHISHLQNIIVQSEINYNSLNNFYNEPIHNRTKRLIIYGHPNANRDCIANSDNLYDLLQIEELKDNFEYLYAHVCWGITVLKISRFGKLTPTYFSFDGPQILWIDQVELREFYQSFISSLHKLIYETPIDKLKEEVSKLIDSTVLSLKKNINSIENDLRISHILYPFIKQYKLNSKNE